VKTTTVWRMLATSLLLAMTGCGGSDNSCETIRCIFLAYPEIRIASQPANSSVIVGQTASFDVVVSSVSANPVQVQWQRCDAGQDCTLESGWRNLAGETRFTLTTAPAALADNNASFRVAAHADDGQNITSNAAVLSVRSDGDAVFSDAAFADADWLMTTFVGGTGGAAAAVQVVDGGNAGAYREVALQVNAARANETASIFSFHWLRAATYEPQLSGPITSIDYTRDERLFVGRGDGQATALALQQDGNVYFAVYGSLPENVWTHRSSNGLTVMDFTLLAPDLAQSPQRPDFSAQGSRMTFGFLRANSTGVGGAAYATRAGIDNWSVTVHR